MAQALGNLPVGANVKFGKYSVNGEAAQSIIWRVVAKNHSSTPAYPTNAITLLTEKVIDFRAIDAQETSNSESSRRSGGNNRYILSNMDQWLNKDSEGGAWYEAQHSFDQSPTSEYVRGGTAYVSRPGFLNAFTTSEKNAILSTTLRVAKANVDGGGYEDFSRKVFIPSTTEVNVSVGNGISEGSVWNYFTNHNTLCWMTSQAFTNTTLTNKPASASEQRGWWTRTPQATYPERNYVFSNDGDLSNNPVYNGVFGVRPALNLSSTISVSDTTDSEGCYTVIPNAAPSAPTIVSAPTTVYGGKSNPISWSSVTDPEGDAVTYRLECSVNQGAYTEIYRGTSTTYAHLVPFGTTSVVYRVKATDPSGESSAYTTSATKTVVNNNAPVISGADTNLGVKSDGFMYGYMITDANADAVTVTEAIDGVQIRASVATLNMPISCNISGNTWLTLTNGSHTLTITATDGIDTTVRTVVFTKLVTGFTIQYSAPNTSTTRPSRIMIVVTRNIPTEATFKVEVCNNGLQSSPTWEDCTQYVEKGLVYSFTNQSNSGSAWRVLIRVTVERNGASGACYVSAIGGNFE